MTHSDLVDTAVRWLRRGTPVGSNGHKTKCTMVAGEIVTAASETPDAIGFVRGFVVVVECKVSRV